MIEEKIGAAVVDSERPTTCLQMCEEMVLVEDLPFIAGSRRSAWRADDTRVWFELVWTSCFFERLFSAVSNNVGNGST
jgi:hypothetical protein